MRSRTVWRVVLRYLCRPVRERGSLRMTRRRDFSTTVDFRSNACFDLVAHVQLPLQRARVGWPQLAI